MILETDLVFNTKNWRETICPGCSVDPGDLYARPLLKGEAPPPQGAEQVLIPAIWNVYYKLIEAQKQMDHWNFRVGATLVGEALDYLTEQGYGPKERD